MRSSPQNTRFEEPILQILPSAQHDKRCPAAIGHDEAADGQDGKGQHRLDIRFSAVTAQRRRRAPSKGSRRLWLLPPGTPPAHKIGLSGARTTSKTPLEHKTALPGARTSSKTPLEYKNALPGDTSSPGKHRIDKVQYIILTPYSFASLY